MSVTLADLRRLLEGALKHEDNPAIQRLPESERTVEGVARAYLSRVCCLWFITTGGTPDPFCANMVALLKNHAWGESPLDLTDPGTAHTLLAALTLYLGLDPGEGGLGVSWRPDGPGWSLEGVPTILTQRACVWFEARDREQLDDTTDPGGGDGPLDMGHTLFLHTPEVASEPNARKVLALAVRHVLATQ